MANYRHDGVDGGSFLACEDFGVMFEIHSQPVAFFFLSSVKWRSARAH